ncbi:unnamed protein product [Cunninghamella echinulata]
MYIYTKLDSTYKSILSTEQSKWIIFKKDTTTLKSSQNNTGLKFNSKHLQIVKFYNQWIKNLEARSVAPSYGNIKRLYTKTEDMKTGAYVNFIGQVISYLPITGQPMSKTNLFLTDYTKNNLPIKLVEKKNKDYPIESDYILQCTLWDENADGCPELSFGDYIFISNAQCKLSRIKSLEIAVRGLRTNDDRSRTPKIPRIHVLNEDDPLLKDLKNQKCLYETRNKRLSESDSQLTQEIKKKRYPDIEDNNLTQKPKAPKLYSVYAKCKQTPPKYSTINEVINGEREIKYFLHGSFVDYKPKKITEIYRKFCQPCDQSFEGATEYCGLCQNKNLIPAYRCMFLFMDDSGNKLAVDAAATEDHPLFHDISVLNLNENKQAGQDIYKRLEELCKLNETNMRSTFDLCVMVFEHHGQSRYVVTDTEIYLD